MAKKTKVAPDAESTVGSASEGSSFNLQALTRNDDPGILYV